MVPTATGSSEMLPEMQVGTLPVNAIEAQGLRKVYRANTDNGHSENEALKGVDLVVPRGSFFGLLGPNGAGKSTFINILAGLVTKSAGEAKVWGHDITSDARQACLSMGVVSQEVFIDPFFTPRESLEFQAGLYAVPKNRRETDKILAALSLSDVADAYARTLSGGMKRRLMVAKAMVHRPPILILDEPTAGVDVELREQLWIYVKELNRQGVTIVLTTHYLEEAEALCDRIAIINHGELVTCEPTPDLLARLDSKELIVTCDPRPTALPAAFARWNAKLAADGRIAIRYRPSITRMDELLAAFGSENLTVVDLVTRESSLEDVFRSLTSAQK